VRTWLVVGAFCILLAYMLLVEARRAPPPDPETTPTPWPILGWEIDDLEAVQFSDGQRTVRLEREGDRWRIVQPPEAGGAPADPRTVYFAFFELASLKARAPLSSPDPDPATYGLDVPALTVNVEARSGRGQVHVGRQTADGTAFYVRREGDPQLYVVDYYKFEYLFKWLSDLPYEATPAPGG
jgi:hypothetical protein